MGNMSFRAWDKEFKYMLYTNDDLIVCVSSNGIEAIDTNLTIGVSDGDMKNVEIMQSTGLKDINGVEIYEGDIVENSHKEVGFIKNCNDAFCFNRQERNFYLSGIGAGSPFKILGNVHQNTELLEE